jgi:lysophospholipase L1-like esterase
LLSVAAFGLGTSAVRAEDAKVLLVAMGDSITRGFGPSVAAEETFAALLEAELRQKKLKAAVFKADVGGERTDQALKRQDQAVLTPFAQPHCDNRVMPGSKTIVWSQNST